MNNSKIQTIQQTIPMNQNSQGFTEISVSYIKHEGFVITIERMELRGLQEKGGGCSHHHSDLQFSRQRLTLTHLNLGLEHRRFHAVNDPPTTNGRLLAWPLQYEGPSTKVDSSSNEGGFVFVMSRQLCFGANCRFCLRGIIRGLYVWNSSLYASL